MSSELLREAQDPNTTAARLMEIAQSSRDTWEAIAAHPAAYPGLLDWLGEHGDDAVKAAIARREIAQLPPPPPPAADAAPTAPIPAPPAPPAPPASVNEPAGAEPTLVQPAASAETAAAPIGSESKGGSANAVRIGVVAVVLAALVGGGWFGVQALTGDDDKKSDVTAEVTAPAGGLDDLDGDAGDDSASATELCDLMDKTRDLGLSEIGTLRSDPSKQDEMLSKIEGVVDVYRDVEKVAPAELKDDAATLADYFEYLGDSLSSGGRAAAPVDTSDFTAAAGRLSRYYASNCM